MSQQVDFYSVGEWLEAESPFNKSFILTRGYSGNDRRREDNIFDWSKKTLDSVCGRILFFINHLRSEMKADSFTLEPNTIYTQGGELCFTYSYLDWNFTILVERVGRSLFFEAGAIVTLHSKEHNG